MNTLHRVVVALVTGSVAFVLAGVAATELFSPYIEFSLFVGIPFGLWAAIAVTGLLYAGLWYRDAAEPRSPVVVGSFRTATAVAVAFLAVSVVGILWYFGSGGPVALSLLIYGLPVAMLAAGILGAVGSVILAGTGRNGGKRGPTVQ